MTSLGSHQAHTAQDVHDRARTCSMQRPHLLTETHVGKATPFSMFFPLNTLPTALRVVDATALQHEPPMCQDDSSRKVLEPFGSYSVIEASPREHKSTIFVPAFASLTTAANASAHLHMKSGLCVLAACPVARTGHRGSLPGTTTKTRTHCLRCLPLL